MNVPHYRRYSRGLTRLDGECNGQPRWAMLPTLRGEIRPYLDGAHLVPVETVPVGARSQLIDYAVGAGLVALGYVVAVLAR